VAKPTDGLHARGAPEASEGGLLARRDHLRGTLGAAASLAAGPLACGGATGPPASDGWDAGPLLHLLPTADHRRIRLKASFRRALDAPQLAVGDRRVRGQLPVPSGTLSAEEMLPPLEENGFSLLDFDRNGLRVSFFRWTPEQGEAALESLEPFRVLTLPRPGRT